MDREWKSFASQNSRNWKRVKMKEFKSVYLLIHSVDILVNVGTSATIKLIASDKMVWPAATWRWCWRCKSRPEPRDLCPLCASPPPAAATPPCSTARSIPPAAQKIFLTIIKCFSVLKVCWSNIPQLLNLNTTKRIPWNYSKTPVNADGHFPPFSLISSMDFKISKIINRAEAEAGGGGG